MGTIRERLSLLVWSSWRVSIYAAVSTILLLGTKGLHAQQTPPPGNGAAQESSSEMAVKDEVTAVTEGEWAKFRVNVRLVLARVVVRDARGNAVGNLHQDDFRIFDNGRPQVISNFDVEAAPEASASAGTPLAGEPSNAATHPEFPNRYVAYVFDDLHMEFGNLESVQQAAQRHIDNLAATDRVAILTTSGQTVLDFTDDRAKLHETLGRLKPRPTIERSKCPDISFYMADWIANKHDKAVLTTAVNDYIRCANLPPQMVATAPHFVEGLATQIVATGEEESRTGLRVLKAIVRRMAEMPGQRSLVLVSPGFLTPELQYDYNDLIDEALRRQVVISSLDARGFYVSIPFGDASQQGHADVGGRSRASLDTEAASAESDILAVLAYSTGGTFFHNNNDMNEGFRRVANAPEFYYILGFIPHSIKSDGKYHTIKVTLANHQKYELQARRGYYASRRDVTEAEEAKREVEDEVFSSEELHGLPVSLHTEFFKPSDDLAKLTVLAHVDVKRLHYKQSNERHLNDLTLVTAVFDRNGNFLHGDEKLVQMRWKGETLQAKLGSGITLKTSFDVKPGRYLVRVVARDSEQQVMSAENGVVEIP
jgi:VWFA-related protein